MPKLLLAMSTGNRAVPQGRSGTAAIIAKNGSAQRGTSPAGGCHSLQSASGTRSPPSPPSTGMQAQGGLAAQERRGGGAGVPQRGHATARRQ